jgi:hypothetical protein
MLMLITICAFRYASQVKPEGFRLLFKNSPPKYPSQNHKTFFA